ncbi:DUF5052 domain-containing protein [Lysinibacillus sp. 2017]|uniref:DUF5052 family protein n=1 Tax=unclassified Lysinibacillus TaxID=2636778 RepID=UPI000D5296F7|nr:MULTISPECIES: DUF5052 family protein [unclassified Lysinibacillus]AWE07256.1 DUF5052 domain-containing protein [Lysinibacillus sp. 2017]TGN33313.1 DUF5052 family protein [Lysinibacillus sp. S2017]
MKKGLFISVILCATIVLSGCNWLEMKFGNIKEQFVGRELTIQTYDENSQLIDRVQGKSVSIEADDKFSLKDKEGNTVEKSSVLNITVGGKQMLHVGSSLIAYEDGLEDLFDIYSQQVDLSNFDRSVPFINRMVNDLSNYTTGKDKVVLVRSQSGQPLATFAGKDVSYYATEMDKSTGLLIDGHYLFIYRCDYTIYDMSLLAGS